MISDASYESSGRIHTSSGISIILTGCTRGALFSRSSTSSINFGRARSNTSSHSRHSLGTSCLHIAWSKSSSNRILKRKDTSFEFCSNTRDTANQRGQSSQSKFDNRTHQIAYGRKNCRGIVTDSVGHTIDERYHQLYAGIHQSRDLSRQSCHQTDNELDTSRRNLRGVGRQRCQNCESELQDAVYDHGNTGRQSCHNGGYKLNYSHADSFSTVSDCLSKCNNTVSDLLKEHRNQAHQRCHNGYDSCCTSGTGDRQSRQSGRKRQNTCANCNTGNAKQSQRTTQSKNNRSNGGKCIACNTENNKCTSHNTERSSNLSDRHITKTLQCGS